MFCPKCGADVPAGAAFCPKCGYKCEGSSTPPPTGDAPKAEEKMDAKTFTDVKSDDVIANVKSGGFFKRVISILFSPGKEWDKIAKEKPKVPMMIFGYLLILGVVAFICIFIGTIIDILRYPYVSMDMLFSFYFVKIITFSVLKLVALIATPIVAALIINALCPAFKTEKNFGKVMQLTAYSFTPVFIAWTMYLIPFGFIHYLVHLAGLYGILILLMGFKKVLAIPANRQVGFFFAMAGILYGVYYVMYWTIQFIELPVYSMGYNYMP
jgi:Yip1 domain/zinc-ribbon domain